MYVVVNQPCDKVRDVLQKFQELQDMMAEVNNARNELKKVKSEAIAELAGITDNGILSDVYLVMIDGKIHAIETDTEAGKIISIQEVFEAR